MPCSVGSAPKSLHHIWLRALLTGEVKPQSLEEDSLVFGGLCDTTPTDAYVGAGVDLHSLRCRRVRFPERQLSLSRSSLLFGYPLNTNPPRFTQLAR